MPAIIPSVGEELTGQLISVPVQHYHVEINNPTKNAEN
jgi:hypothetical protein